MGNSFSNSGVSIFLFSVKSKVFEPLLLLLFFLVLPLVSFGQNTWTGATSTAWGTSGNWSANHVPLVSEDVVIPNTTNKPIIVVAGAVCKTLTINNAGSGTNTLTITSPGTLVVSSLVTLNNGATVGTAISGTGAITLKGGLGVTGTGSSGALVSCPVILGANTTFTIDDTAAPIDLAISGVISGAFTVTKTGAGLVNLSGANTYTKATAVSAGTLQLNNPTAVGTTSGITVTSGAVLDLNGITLATARLLTLNGTGISGGALINSSATAVAYSGLITLGSASSIISNAGTITISNIATISGAFPLTLGGVSNGEVKSKIGNAAGGVTKIDSGTWTLSGVNTYSGSTAINAGTIKLGVTGTTTNSALGNTTGGTIVTSGAVLDLNGYSILSKEPLTLNGTGLASSPAGVLTNTGGAAICKAIITLASDVTINATTSGTLTCNNTITGAFGLTLDGAGSGTMAWILSGLTSLNKNGSGTWTLAKANNYPGPTLVNVGTMSMSVAQVLNGDLIIGNGATLNTQNKALTFQGNFKNNGGTFATGTSVITIGGTNTQSIDGFSTMGAITVSKTGGVATFAGSVSTSKSLTVPAGPRLNLGTGLVHSANILSLAGISVAGGSWGSTTSTATNKNNTYFGADTGIVNNAALPCTTGYWIGVTDTNWATPGNWCNGLVPLATTDVVIPAGTAKSPTINIAALCNNLTIDPGASLNVPNNNSLTISGDFLNNGTFTAGATSTTSFVGANQIVGGGGGTFGIVTFAGTGIKTLRDPLSATGIVTINSGVVLDTNSNTLTFQGSFVNNGSFLAGDSDVIITGSNTQNIGGFTTTGDVSVTKSGTSTATFTGAVTAGGLLLNASATTTLDLGTFSHTFSGDLTLTKGTLLANSSTLNVGGNLSGAGVFTPGTSTVVLNGGVQSVGLSSFNNLTLSGTGTKTFVNATTIGANLAIDSGVIADLGVGLTHSANTLTLGGVGALLGSWGSTASTAVNKNNIYFLADSGLVNVFATSCGVGEWTGKVSTDWNNAANWCSTVPTNITNVVIPSGTPYPPIIAAGTTAQCKDLTINSGATLTLANDATSLLNIYRNFFNSGTYTTNTLGTTNFCGNINQVIAGGTYTNLTISGTLAKALTGNVTVDGILTVKANTTLNLGAFTLDTPTSVLLECGATAGSIISGTGELKLEGNVKVTSLGTGTNGATISCPIRMNSSTTFTIADDGSAAVDLTLSDDLFGNGSADFTKAGAGKMIMSGDNDFTGSTFINEGILQLGSGNLFSPSTGAIITLAGGTLSTGALIGHSEAAGPLGLSANSIISLGVGTQSLEFRDSHAISWTAGTILTVKEWVGNYDGTTGTNGKIYVENNTGLTVAQLAQIKFIKPSTGVSYPAIILADGEVVPGSLITTAAITGSPFCAGTSVSVPFTIDGAFNSGNIFTAQLSDASGSFATPTNIGAVTQTTAGTISATIPVSTHSGTVYRIRVVSSDPVVVGTNNGADLIVNALPGTPSPGIPTQPTCMAGGSVVLSNLPTTGTWTLKQNGTPIPDTSAGTGTATVSGLAIGSYVFTVENGACASLPSSPVAITGAVTAIWDGSSWSSGTPPTLTDAVIIRGHYNTTTNGTLKTLNACSLTIESPYILTIDSGGYVVVQNDLKVDGTLNSKDTGSLVMMNDLGSVSGIGTTTIQRGTTPYKKNDYVYWSSPVANATIANTFSNWRLDYAFGYGGSWMYTLGVMSPGTGYIVMVPNPLISPETSTVVFTGAVNNGVQKIPGVSVDSDYLVGNPYPSALYADQFIFDNKDVITGTLSFWTHNTAIQLASGIASGTAGSGAYAYTSDDYAYYNLTGGVGTGQGTVAISPGSAPIPSGKIGSGQGFFVKTNSSITGANDIVFNNAMRLDQTGKVLNNSQFFKTKAPVVQKTTPIEKNRVWLDLSNSQGAFKQTLLGYISGATNAVDNLYDGETLDGNDYIDFYSINQNKNLAIQGRALPFDKKEEVPLGYKSNIAGSFVISIDQVDGFFTNQSVFLEDKATGSVVDLKKSSYSFATKTGTFNDRFVLKYVDKTLGTADLSQQVNQVLVSVKNKQIKIDSAVEIISKVVIYDVSGKELYQKNQVNTNELMVANFTPANQVLIVKTTLQNGKTAVAKIIF